LVATSDAQDVRIAQPDGAQMLDEEHVSDQFQYAAAFRNTLLTVIHAFHAQEIG
jgi:hypothetical protein